ncbi:lipid A core-O-antigen ligase-like enyme [Leptolyngbya sp. PCC 7375]|nr:lipid A core-O-antigen ligase-like enyme [Leptolyngbya sp. PCC 7375]
MELFKRLTTYDSLLGVSLLGFATFAWLPDSYFRMVSWPWVLVWQGAFLLVFGICIGRLRRFQQPFYLLGFGFDWLILGLFLCLIVSSVIAPFPILALQNSLLVSCYVILIYGLCNSRFSALQLCQGVVWVGAIAAIISLALWRPTPAMWLSSNFYDAIRNRFPLGHHNFTGGYFVLVLPTAVGIAWLQLGWKRWVYGLLAVVITIALYASGSRGAWLGGVLLLLLTLAMGIVRSRGKTRLSVLLLALLTICLAVGVLMSNPRMRSLVPIDIDSAPRATTLRPVTDGPTSDRFFMAQAAVNILQDRPLGLGPGNLGRVYERYRPLEVGTGLNQVQQLHNSPLQIAAELGVGGLALYGGVVICLVRLHRQFKHLASPQHRQLSLMATLGFLGYGVSSLTDYQLENIPIAVTLSVLLVSLLKLGRELTFSTFSKSTGRVGSLLLLIMVVLIVQVWLRTDLALWMTHQGLSLTGQGNLSQANAKFYKASTLAPWDPIPAALGAQQLSSLAETASDENQKILREEAIQLYQQTLRVAPNDIWFNQNLAVLAWQLGHVEQAHQAITKVVQLSPRSKNHSYYLLGLTYQAMGDTESAIAALALECLINPQVLTFQSWQQELSPLRSAVFTRVLQHYQTVLSALEPNHPLYSPLAAHITTLTWWSNSTFQVQKAEDSRRLHQALFTIEENPEQAAILLDRCIVEATDDVSGCRLLKAWLQTSYLPDYLEAVALNPIEKEKVRSHILTERTLKDWFWSTTQPVFSNQRVGLALLYRSYYAKRVSSILLPENLRQFSIPVSLNLFSLSWPREFPPLDHLVESLRTEAFGLPHPTRNNFKFSHFPNSDVS